MDPLSLTASVAGVVTILVQTIKITNDYINGVGNSVEAAKSFLEELTALSSNLKRLEEFLKTGSPQAKVFEGTSALITQTNVYKEKLKTLETKLRNVISSRLRQALWPLSRGEHKQAIQDLRAFSQWIHFSLTLDSSMVLSKSAEDISSILSAQLKFIAELNNIENRIAAIESSVRTQESSLMSDAEQEQFEKCLAWIPSIDQESKHASIKEPRVEGTGDWVLEDAKFELWKNGKDETSSNMLLCLGDQGVGKSVLASKIIDLIQDEANDEPPLNANLAFVYLQRQERDTTTTLKVLGSLAKQLLSSLNHIPEEFLAKFKRAKRGSQPDLQSVNHLLRQTCSLTPRTYVVVDALDEAGHTDIAYELRQLAQVVTVRLCVTSRSHAFGTRGYFKNAANIHIRARDVDIKRYIQRQIDKNPTAVIADPKTQTTIIDSIASKAQQMFLLAVLQIHEVLNAPTIGEMKEALQKVPVSLEQAFDNTMLQIAALSEPNRLLALKSLMWLSCIKSGYKLRAKDLCEALALRLDQKITNEEYRPGIETVIDRCQGLVTVEKTTEHVVFIHDAVREYLVDKKRGDLREEIGDPADFCLIYLRTEPVLEKLFTTEAELDASLAQSPFLQYAILAWDYHLGLSGNGSSMQSALDLLKLQKRRKCISQLRQYLKGRRELYWDSREVGSQTELHVAAEFGLTTMAYTLLNQKTHNVDVPTLLGTTALMISSSKGDTAMIRLLLRHGADPTIMNWYGNSLHAAAEAGQPVAIEKLLEYSSGSTREAQTWIDYPNSHGYTAVECATMENHPEAVQKLLEWGATSSELVLNGSIFSFVLNKDDFLVNIPRDNANDSFIVAFSEAFVQRDINFIIRAINYVSKRDKFDRRAHGYNTKPLDRIIRFGKMYSYSIKPLHLAAALGDVESVKRLLDAGADVNAGTRPGSIRDRFASFDQDGREIGGPTFTPYAFAVARGHVAVQDLLLQRGAFPSSNIDEAQIDRLLVAKRR